MGSDTQFVKQSVVVSQDELIPSRMHERIALFNADGTPLDLSPNDVAAYQAASVATTVAGLVTDFNALLTKLQTAGLMATS